MLDFFITWLRSHHLVYNLGLSGVFLLSFVGSTIFVPFPSEPLLLMAVAAGANKFWVVIIATIGSVGGTLVNYYLGFEGITIINKYLRKEDSEKAKHLMNKYGSFGLFTIMTLPLSLPVDPITVVCGIVKMDVNRFTTIVFLSKLIKYSFILGLFSLIF
jgi:membrane protein YqaA with SNARE-associated domain